MTKFNVEHAGTGQIIARCDSYEDAVLEVLTYDGGTVEFGWDDEDNAWTLVWTRVCRRGEIVARVPVIGRVDGSLSEDAARLALLRAVKMTDSDLLWINREEA